MRRVLIAALPLLVVIGGALAVAALTGGDGNRGIEQGRDPATRTTGATGSTPPPDPATTTAAGARGPRGSGETITFAFAGDVHFEDQLAEQLARDAAGVLAPIAPVLSGADLAMVNLETAITERGEPVGGKNFHFRAPAASFTALEAAGVDVVNMANNHALDYGPEGMADTFAAIAETDLPVLGIGHDASEAYRPFRTTIAGQRVAILTALDWLEPALISEWSATETRPGVAFSIDRTRLLAEVTAVRPDVDTLVVYLHWGTEETHCASPEQQSLARSLVDAGADLVVGSHAHRVFGAGRVDNALVAYGLGNFVYWREDGESGRSGVLLADVTGREIDSYSWVPARITDGVPVPQTGDDAAAAVSEWEQRRVCSGLSP